MIMAQLCAVPIVGTNAGGTPEQLGHGKYGELVEPRNPASLANGTLNVLDNLPAAQQMAREQAKTAVERFDMKKVVERILSEYRL
jgi:glycosyltransferase involved in cell wall biosynthesis